MLILLLLQGLQAQSLQPAPAERPPKITAEQEQPVEDPLGRSTPHGTMVGLTTAAKQGNLDRAGEYLESGLKPPDRRELARKLLGIMDIIDTSGTSFAVPPATTPLAKVRALNT